LPAIQTVTIAFLKDILANKKISIHLDNVRPINVPFYSGLSIEQILDFGGKYVDVQNAFPDKKETLKRAYICNVIHSLVGEDFQQWVDNRVNARNKKVAVEGDKIIELDPIIAAVFQNSTAVSTTNGRSFSMLKVGSKRRRTKSQIEADILSGNAKATETTEAINKLNRMIAQQEKEKQAYADEMAK
jgi:hypothetical protein